MERFISAIESALSSKNWFAALTVALTMPDICGYLESPKLSSQVRYENWFQKYMQAKYCSTVGPRHEPHIFLTASDFYALRCALLHEGSDEISEQKARRALRQFFFATPPTWGTIHRNQRNNMLQLQVDIFCRDIISGVRQWISEMHNDLNIKRRMNYIIKIHEISSI